jgi:hypothetical protein
MSTVHESVDTIRITGTGIESCGSTIKVEYPRKIFELYDPNGDTISYHSTLKGALLAMRDKIELETPGLCHAFEDDTEIKIDLRYCIDSIELKD